MRRMLFAAALAAVGACATTGPAVASRLLCDNGGPPLDNGACMDGSVAMYRAESGGDAAGNGAVGTLGLSESEARRREQANQRCITMRAMFPGMSCMLQ